MTQDAASEREASHGCLALRRVTAASDGLALVSVLVAVGGHVVDDIEHRVELLVGVLRHVPDGDRVVLRAS